jgi:subtilisin-like proprotein convertase family protein
MKSVFRTIFFWFAAAALATPAPASQDDAAAAALGPRAVEQIRALMAAKQARTHTERKLSFRLLAAVQESKGISIPGLGKLRSAVKPEEGFVKVDVHGFVGKTLQRQVREAGGVVLASSQKDQVIQARVPLARIEQLAASGLVRSIRPSSEAATHAMRPGRSTRAKDDVLARLGLLRPLQRERLTMLRPGFEERAANVRSKLGAILAAGSGSIVSEGVAAHQADRALDYYGATGALIKVGVLSDSVDFLAAVQGAGELPAVTVLEDIVPPGTGSGEGTAMLEIVHDMAPAAELFFASAFNGEMSFANNIRALRAAGCDIIVDDVFYFEESPFQDGPIAAAVADVTKDGALYFSSAGNEGNLNDGTAGVWEGNFKKARVALPAVTPFGYEIHDFALDNISNRVEADGFATFLFWNEAYGKAKADHDLFILDSGLQEVVDASLDIQNGDDFPIEAVNPPFIGERIVVGRLPKTPVRRLHLNTFRGQLGLGTSGQTHGHSAVVGAYSVAAVNAAWANGAAFVGGQSNPVESFSSDGYRRIYFKADGTAGGGTRKKPDVAAADGVATGTPGFEVFFGTSAAAPHAAGVAALFKSIFPAYTPAQVRSFLTRSTLDIEALGFDRDSGFGIVNIFRALQRAKATPIATVAFSDATATEDTGDGDGFIEPGETGSLSVELANVGGAFATAINATLTTPTPLVTINTGTSGYPDLAPAGAAVNSVPLTFSLDPTAACGLAVDFDYEVAFSGGPSPRQYAFGVLTGQPSATPTTESYGGPVVPIPDASTAGVNIPLVVSGLSRIADLDFRIDGTACDTVAGSTTVGLDHTWVGDLVLKLTSPEGTTVTVISRPGGPDNSANNLCQTLLDDESAGGSIDTVSPVDAPYTGSFLPHEALSAFDGEDPNGTWILNVSDLVGFDTGSVRAFSLLLSGFSCS